ncbi:calcipressin-2-like [Ciona intestinalis]
MEDNFELEDCGDLSPILFACNLNSEIFTSNDLKSQLENQFLTFGPAHFVYLPSFRRMRVEYNTAEEAILAKISLHNTVFHDNEMHIYFSQSAISTQDTTTSLAPPKAEKQFLISPPASPPIGWEPIEENKPMFNFDLISAVVELEPGQSHELHKATTSTPSVVVHICDNLSLAACQPSKIPQTRRPESKNI